MDAMNCECPTEILVDIKENEYQCSHINRKETKTFFNNIESETEIQSHTNEENIALFKSSKKCETILDISPSRIYEEFNDKENIKSQVNLKQNLKSEVSDGCPTALLIDVSPPTGFSLRDNHVSSCTQYLKENRLNDCKASNIENEDLKGRLDRRSNCVNVSKAEESQDSSNSRVVESQMPVKRLRWKTPSPQSMSRISKEASKVIDHLNSSSVFDEDMLLTEEILPVTLNFDELDDDDTDQETSTDIVYKDANFTHELSVSEQSLSKAEKKDKTLNCDSSSDKLGNVKDNLKQVFMETTIVKESFKVSSKSDTNSKESYSSGIHSSSLENPGSLSNCDEADDVFNMTHITFEDKENVQNKKNKLTFIKDSKIGIKTTTKNLLLNKPKLVERGTLRNLSNIKQEASARRLSLSVNKSVTTPFKRMSISGNTKVESRNSLKSFSQSKSFKFQNTKESISSAQKSRATAKSDSGCISLSSDVKQQSMFATPSKRYSISTPLKCASAIKPPLTPALNSSHNFVFPRYTPQPVRPSRLSFSRSWQPSGNNYQHFPAKEFKQKTFTTVPSSMSKIASGINSSKPGKISFSQSMSSASSGKSISKERFSCKVRSPLSVEQDKKVVRALFTNISEK